MADLEQASPRHPPHGAFRSLLLHYYRVAESAAAPRAVFPAHGAADLSTDRSARRSRRRRLCWTRPRTVRCGAAARRGRRGRRGLGARNPGRRRQGASVSPLRPWSAARTAARVPLARLALLASPGHPSPLAAAATPAEVERVLGATAAVTARGGPAQVEIQLGHFCNNRCVFCASGQLTEQGRAQPVPELQVVRALEAAAANGVRRLTLLGGEPTIQDAFLPSLRRAVELGFADITIFTNGTRTADARFVDAVASLGSFTWRISIQGATEAAHDVAVGRRGAFQRIVAGLALLQARHQRVTVNMCLTTHALATLGALPALLLGRGVGQLCIDMVRPVSAGERTDAELKAMMPTFAAAGRALRAMLAELDARAPDFDLNLTHLPFCALPEAAPRIRHGGDATVTFTADLDERQGVMDKYAFQQTDRRKLPECAGCVFFANCSGVPHAYAAWHGAASVRPVTMAEVVAADPTGRALSVAGDQASAEWQQARAWVDRIVRVARRGGARVGWRGALVRIELREGTLELWPRTEPGIAIGARAVAPQAWDATTLRAVNARLAAVIKATRRG
ncbi:MAG: radical SAM protein [Myxococcales bacterium]|nr:radical SAM protein [Myxococcales bacterium]